MFTYLVNHRFRPRLAPLLLALLLAVPAFAPAQAQAPARERVDVELILMADGSGSIDDDEFLLQRHGYARALRHPRVLAAIRNGPTGRIALSYVEWSGHLLQAVIADWVAIASEADIDAFASKLEETPRRIHGGGTAVGSAILYGAESLLENGFEASRSVIDLSGDGPDKDGLPAIVGREQAVARGYTVNGLPILGTFPGLDVFYLDNVIGGPGAFSIPANDFQDFYSAILSKLIREIAGTGDPDAPQAAEAGPAPAGETAPGAP